MLFTITLMVTLLIPTIFVIKKQKEYTGKVFPNVYIDNVDVGGKTKKEILAAFKNREIRIQSTFLSIAYGKELIATYSASMLDVHTNLEETADKASFIGRTTHLPSRIYQLCATLFRLDTFKFYSQVQYDKNIILDSLTQFEDAYNRPAKNALFSFKNERVLSFRKEEDGNVLLRKKFIDDIDEAVRNLKFLQKDSVIALYQEPVKPDVTLASVNSFGIEELIGEGVSNYTHSIPGRIHNVILGASKFNGVLIKKNKILSFNDIIGDISAQTGYQPAYIIKGGKTVLGDGGGVCQVSTTLFRAALNSGLPILERSAHAYRVSYYENDSKPGLDATVFAPTVDLKIENNTPASILIQTEVDEEHMLLYFRLYGKKDGRNAEISTPILYDVAPPPPALFQDDPTLKRGIVKQVDFPAWGGKASFDYKVTRGGQVIYEKKFFSSYKPWQAVFLTGIQD